MKKILFYCTVLLVSIAMFSCSKENTNENILEASKDVLPVKTLTVFAQDQESYMVIDIFNPDFEDLTAENFQIKAKYVDIDQLPAFESDSDNDVSDTDEDVATELLFSKINLAEGFNAFEVKFVQNELYRGKSPSNHDYSARYWASGTQYCFKGFTGHPYNCNHTHWKLKYKSGIFWNTIYSATSYSNTASIGETVTNTASSGTYRIRIDPDKNCNSYAPYTFIYNPC